MNDKAKELKARVQHFDEEIVGCFSCNYGTNRCGAFRSYGCKNAARCKSILKIERKRV